jgi:hypothetical protein
MRHLLFAALLVVASVVGAQTVITPYTSEDMKDLRNTADTPPAPCQPANLVRLLKGLLPHVGRVIRRETVLFPGIVNAVPDLRSEQQRLLDEALSHEAEAAARKADAAAVAKREQLVAEARQAVEACQ